MQNWTSRGVNADECGQGEGEREGVKKSENSAVVMCMAPYWIL